MSYSLNPKENLMTVIRDHKTPEYTPVELDAGIWISAINFIEKGIIGEKPDPFGVLWQMDVNAFGPIPQPGAFLLEDVTKWKKIVTIPNPDDFDIGKWAEDELSVVNRDVQAVYYCSTCGIYERLAALMGFEGALLAMALEPDATFELLSAITDMKIAMAKKAAQYYQPDTFKLFDDVATERAPFMSIEMYDRLIMPLHKKLNDALWELDILPDDHVCGKWDTLMPSKIKEGAAIISVGQPKNDLAGLLAEYSDRVAFIGGFDSVGLPGYTDDIEIVRAERDRCAKEYSKYDGFIYSAMPEGVMKKFDDNGNPLTFDETMASMMALVAEDAEYFRALGSPADRR